MKMRTKLVTLTVALALGVVAAAPAAQANAVKIAGANGKPLALGTKIQGLSTNLVFNTSGGSLGCEEFSLGTELLENSVDPLYLPGLTGSTYNCHALATEYDYEIYDIESYIFLTGNGAGGSGELALEFKKIGEWGGTPADCYGELPVSWSAGGSSISFSGTMYCSGATTMSTSGTLQLKTAGGQSVYVHSS